MTTNNNIDPIELDELEIDTSTIEEGDNDFKGEVTDENDDFDEDGFFDDEEDQDDEDNSDEDQPVVKKPKPKAPKKEKKVDGTIIRKYPEVGAMYSTKTILLEVINKAGKTYKCKVLAAQEPSRRKVGEIFEAEEIAFYSEYYSFAGFAKK